MSAAPYELVRTPDGIVARVKIRGSGVLASATINRGTAFTDEQRRQLGLIGLLPTGVTTLDGQVRRVYGQYREQANDLRGLSCAGLGEILDSQVHRGQAVGRELLGGLVRLCADQDALRFHQSEIAQVQAEDL